MSLRHQPRRWAALTVAVAVVAGLPAYADQHHASNVTITVLSSRADLVSGGDALVAVDGTGSSPVRVTVAGKDVSSTFAVRRDGRLEGLLHGLRLGSSELRATLPDGSGAALSLVNHPNGGPLLSGPQLQPWTCQATARDKQCDQPPTYRFVYRSTNPAKSGFQAYDPKNPPTDVASTTTDNGVTVPFVVRVETGYEDRDQYSIATLFQPGKAWTPFAPQPQFDHKLLITHGASCNVEYVAGTAPDTTSSGITPNVSAAAAALGRGFITMSTALDNSGHDCNVAIQAESLLMAKAHLVTTYGTVRYTIGTGCSGGSLAQQWIANAYPGIYQGILPTCSFPDAWSAATQVADYALLQAYFTDPTKWGVGVAWSPSQWAAVEGNPTPVDALVSVGCLRVLTLWSGCATGYFTAAMSSQKCAGTTDADRYDPQKNPGGVRCTIMDLNVNLLGRRSKRVWTAPEKKIRHGFAGLPIDNVGVQYGLSALQQGLILPSQFLDLNHRVGGSGIDVGLDSVPNRLSADRPALANAYRSGLINETNNLDQTAIIDCRGPDPGAAHDSFRAFAVRARLDREHHSHANQLIWEGPAPLIADAQCELNSFTAMDRWLAAVEKDHSGLPVARKLVRDKPADLGDECFDGAGQKLADGLCPSAVVPVYGTSRMVAGDAITTDTNKCRLRPVRRADYPLTFTNADFASLKAVFPNGVCDFTKPGVDQQPTIPWQTYQQAGGQVVFGGRPLGPPPQSHAFGPGNH